VAELLPKLVTHFDEPFADNSMIPTYQVSRLARQHVTVALSGDGGDEVFGGYQWYRRAARLARLQSWLPRTVRPALARLAGSLPGLGAAREYLARADQPLTCWRAGESLFLSEDLRRLVQGNLASLTDQPESRRRRELESVADRPWLSQLQHLDLHGFLPAGVLVKVDRASMFPSLEVRSPLLDHVVFEFMARVPPELKVNGHESKVLLKRAVADLLPPVILNRRKRGFDLPTGAWLRGPLLPLLQDALLSANAWTSRLLNRREVERLVSTHASAQADHKGRLWALLCLELWARAHAPSAAHG
jgi:asparagine synthase (glutamine-hydrolysing)